MRSVTTLATAAVITASGNTTAIGLPSEVTEVTAFVAVSAVSGTTPSAVFTVQFSHNNLEFADALSGAAITVAANQRIAVPSNVGDFARVSYAVSGTTPSFTATIVLDSRG